MTTLALYLAVGVPLTLALAGPALYREWAANRCRKHGHRWHSSPEKTFSS